MRAGRVAASVVFVIAGAVFLAGVVRLSVTARQDPPRFELEAGDGVPVTLMLPAERDDDGLVPIPAPGERPPVVVLAHGFSADRGSMRGLAEGLAANGYAAASLDFRGHGASRHPFRGDLVEDIEATINTLEENGFVDGQRVALLGHSMGGGAVAAAAARDPRPDAVVAVSGVRVTSASPANALLLVASGDPASTRAATRRVAGHLADRPLDFGTTSGSLAAGDAVRPVLIEGADHLTILGSEEALAETVRWLDGTWGVQRDRPVAPMGRGFGGLVLPLMAAIVLIGGAGWVAGRAAPAARTTTAGVIPGGLGLMLGALLIALPLAATLGSGLLPILVADSIVTLMLVAAGLLLVLRWVLARRGASPGWSSIGERPFAGTRRSLAVAAAALAGVYVLLAPLIGPVHRVVPTPARLVVGVMTAALLFPFAALGASLVRRGSTLTAALGGIGSRLVVLAVVLGGAMLGLLPGVIMLAVPLLVLLFVLIEVFAIPAYAAGRNPVLIALVEAGWLGWLMAAILPITV